jgi:hypothetical protein
MSQTRRQSLAESIAQQVVGLLLSLLAWEFIIGPIWKIQTTVGDNIAITMVFTALSMVRGYFLRRLFNRLHQA